MERVARLLANIDLPLPMTPAKSWFGLVSAPLV
jgi:hypothetical protein